MTGDVDARGVRLQFRLRGDEKVIVLSEARLEQLRRIRHTIWNEPFARRTWSELLFFVLSVLLAAAGMAFIALTMFAGIALAVTFIGLVIIAGSLRGARGIGGFHRALARNLLDEHIQEPEPFVARPGFFGWLQSALRDPIGWRSVAYSLLKMPLAVFGVWFALSVWVDAFFCLTYPLWGDGALRPPEYGFVVNAFSPGYLSAGTSGFFHSVFIFVTGVILVFLAPWPMRAVVYVDRRLMRLLLAPDAMTARVRSLEHARAQTLDTSAATLRRIERDLHDGTQAQLVAVAMRLGQVKEKLAADATDSTSTRSASWWTTPTRGPRRPSSSCVTWPGASIPPPSTSASRGRCPPWPPAARCPPTSPSPSPTVPPRPSNRSPISAWPS